MSCFFLLKFFSSFLPSCWHEGWSCLVFRSFERSSSSLRLKHDRRKVSSRVFVSTSKHEISWRKHISLSLSFTFCSWNPMFISQQKRNIFLFKKEASSKSSDAFLFLQSNWWPALACFTVTIVHSRHLVAKQFLIDLLATFAFVCFVTISLISKVAGRADVQRGAKKVKCYSE